MHTFLLHHLLSDSADRYSDNDAVVVNGESITYGDLETTSSRLARALVRIGVRAGDRVGILLEKSLQSVVALFAVLKTGASYVPIDPQAPAGRVQFIVDNCGIESLIASGRAAQKIVPHLGASASLKNIVLAGGGAHPGAEERRKLNFLLLEELVRDDSVNVRLPDIADTSPAYILHTSGSTGFPKGVVISHMNSLAFVDMAAYFFGIEHGDRLSSHAPFYFDLSVFDIFVAIKSGATIVLVPENISLFPIKLAQYIEDSKISVWNSVASVLPLLAERGRLERFSYESLRLVLFSGEVLPVKYLRAIKRYMKRAEFYNLYGQTEANSSTWYRIEEIPEDDGWKIPIGRSFPNFDVFALGEDGEVVTSPGGAGELYVGASTVAIGYWRDMERTLEAFVQDPRSFPPRNTVYRTGDLVRIDGQGNYVFLGRRDQQVKSRGYRIQLGEIEFVLNSHPKVNEAVVVAVPDDLIGNRIVSFVSPDAGVELSALEMSDYVSRFLPGYMVPEKISFVETFQKTPTGKVDRKLLQKIACSLPVH